MASPRASEDAALEPPVSDAQAAPGQGASSDADDEMEASEVSILRSAKVLNDNERTTRLTMHLIRQSMSMTIRQSTKRLLSVEDDGDGVPESAEEDTEALDAHDPDTTALTRAGDEESREIDALLQKKVLRLDWMNIGRIENLDAFTHVQELYLQHNLIERIENLDDHVALTFLALAGNRIKTVENIKHLAQLKFLDLSNNCIADFDIHEFPESLVILRLAGNPFVRHMPAYVHLFFERLPNLVQVDQFRRHPSSVTDSAPSVPKSMTDEVSPASPSARKNRTGPNTLSFSPRSAFVDLQMEIEMNPTLQSRREVSEPVDGAAVHPHPHAIDQMATPSSVSSSPLSTSPSASPVTTPSNNDTAKEASIFDFGDYEREKQVRLDAWRQQLKALETRKSELEQYIPVATRTTSTANLRARRKLVLDRARAGTSAAIAESTTHFHEMEVQHQEWQEQQQQQQTA